LANGLRSPTWTVAGFKKGTTLVVEAAHGVLANDIDPNINDHLTVTSVDGTAGTSTSPFKGNMDL
jgi:hypothetical protein